MEEYYDFLMSSCPGIGNHRAEKLYAMFGSSKGAVEASVTDLVDSGILKKEEGEIFYDHVRSGANYQAYCQLKKDKIQLVSVHQKAYPTRLLTIPNRPYLLYIKGELPKEQPYSVAVVGARTCTQYGETMAFQIGRQLAMAGVNVISGLAKGIDGAAHRGALSVEGGKTYACLAGGVDLCFPREHIAMYEEMSERGGLISEYPPGMKPLAKHFPLRNRIISGLSDVVVVVEARERSGSLITVDAALEQNRMVMAVPGRMCDKMSLGCNQLLKLGAGIVTRPRDILEMLTQEVFHEDGYGCYRMDEEKEEALRCEEQSLKEQEKVKDHSLLHSLSAQEQMIYKVLDCTPKSINQITEESKMKIGMVIEALVSMEFKGFVKESARGSFERLL
ncbi:MAG: DNA-processing protein DprA [Lachnospiraceae bacterium]|nr:DNA-processing protein DprA [Lachnospiraceae bacterium]